MIIILEGPDGAGKTTLANKLCKSIPGSTLLHYGAPTDAVAAENYWQVYAEDILKASTASVLIMDRSWYTDMVYGPVLRGSLEMTATKCKMLEALVLANGGGLVIYCTSSPKVLWSRVMRRGDPLIKDTETLRALYDGYEALFKEGVTLPVVKYDTRD